MKALKLDPEHLQQLEKLLPLFVFVIALVIRLYYDLVISQQRLCSFGDGYFFLKTGQELAKSITTAASFPDFLTKLTVHTSEVAGGVATFGSGALADRLLLDGPVYTSFLAIVHILAGIVGTTDYAQNSNIFSVANSLIDSISCLLIYLCGRLAFNRKAGLIAALLFAVYPAATLNTRLCYSELYTYFLLLCWSTITLSLFRSEEKQRKFVRPALSFLIGVTSILIVLARSVFFPLPLAALAVLFVPDWKTKRINAPAVLTSVAAMIVGGALIMAPWLWFTHDITGKFVPWVNRAPGYNLFVGNQLNTDGWRTWPAQPGIPNEASDAMKSISRNFASDPCRFAGLLLRKESRLWAGVWNDFKHKFFGVPWQAQNVFQNLILMLSVIGFIGAIREPSTRRPAAVFAIFAAYHSVYACFEPVARYGITAMPFVFLLAGQSFSKSPSPCRSPMFYALMIFGVLFFALLDSHFSFIPLLFSILPTDKMLPIALVDFAIWTAGWLLLGALARKQLLNPKWWQSGIVWSMAGLLIAITASALLFDPAKTEWYTELKSPNDAVHAVFSIPQSPPDSAPVSYLLVDLRSEFSAPMVSATVNGTVTEPPMPVLQLMSDRDDASGIYSQQAQAMGVDTRSFRHWWAFPVPTKAITSGSPNLVDISFLPQGDTASIPVKLFGDYPSTDDTRSEPQFITIPSINKFSWVKGFVTIDRRDPRLYENVEVKRAIANCSLKTAQGNTTSDLSTALGRQFGNYRMFLYVPPNTTPVVSAAEFGDESVILFANKQERLVSGGDPSTMLMNSQPVRIPTASNAAFYTLTCELQAVKRRSIGGISVAFQGTTNESGVSKTGKSWTSPWSPTSLDLPDKNWHKFTFFSRLPENIAKQPNITAAMMLSPFSADRLFLHHKDALRDSVKVRNVELRYYRHLAPPLSALEYSRVF